MSWIRIEDKFCSHPKLMQGGALAICLQIRALCYAGQHLTDGLIPSGALTTMTADFCELDLLGHPSHPEGATNAGGIEWGDRMVELGLWDVHEHGWMIHDYLDYNPSRKDQEALQRLRQREGKKAALKRWGEERRRRTVDHPPVITNGRDYVAESKEVLAFLNLKTSKQFREVDANLGPIQARLKSDVDVQACKTLIARKVRDWSTNADMVKYLRPETLFNKTKFETYLAEVTP